MKKNQQSVLEASGGKEMLQQILQHRKTPMLYTQDLLINVIKYLTISSQNHKIAMLNPNPCWCFQLVNPLTHEERASASVIPTSQTFFFFFLILFFQLSELRKINNCVIHSRCLQSGDTEEQNWTPGDEKPAAQGCPPSQPPSCLVRRIENMQSILKRS